MRALAYTLLILGVLAVDMVSDLFVRAAEDRQSWDLTATLGVILGVALLVNDHLRKPVPPAPHVSITTKEDPMDVEIASLLKKKP